MTLQEIISGIDDEIARLERARDLLAANKQPSASQGRPPASGKKTVMAKPPMAKRTLSAAGRKRIVAAQRARWAAKRAAAEKSAEKADAKSLVKRVPPRNAPEKRLKKTLIKPSSALSGRSDTIAVSKSN